MSQLSLRCRVKRHLEPLAVAANICQSDHTRLDTVLLTLANLFRLFADPDVDEDTRAGMHRSLEKRWAAAGVERDAMIATLALNPYIRCRCFKTGNVAVTPNGLLTILERLYTRMFQHEPDAGFAAAFLDYRENLGEFSDAEMHLDVRKSRADAAVSPFVCS